MRLWPLSNETRSKQFLKVLRDENGQPQSMVQRVMGQIRKVEASIDVTIATGEAQAFSIERQVSGDYTLVLEPERRDTAPAIMLACANLMYEQQAFPNDTVIVMPIDTFADQAYYDMIPYLDRVVQSSTSDLILLGVKPTYPSEKYGYIVPCERIGNAWPVKEFVEKPGRRQAELLISQGALWNCGVFAFTLGYLMELVMRYTDASSFADMQRLYSRLPKNSFDYEVVEKAASISVVPYEGVWRDLGTWNTLTDEMQDIASGCVVMDIATCDGTYAVNETGLPLVISGIEDAVVVATYDGILVSSKESSAQLKPLIAKAAESRPMYEQRKWGEYRVLDSRVYPDGARSLTKELILNPGCQISHQRHAHRSEVWTVVSGEGEVALDGVVSHVHSGTVVDISIGAKHALRAITELHLIEVQLGALLEEADIERFGNYWG